MKIEGKFIFKVAGTLTAISLVVALLLGLTNMLTADKIAAINKQKTEEALAKVVSAADCEFPPMEEIPQAMIDAANEQGGKLSEVYEVQSGGDTIGYAFKVTASGSQGNIVMIVGVDTDLTVTGVSIVKASETAGIAPRSSTMKRPPQAPARSISSSASPARARSSSSRTSTPSPARRSPPRA